ncbi:hypothetical protein GGX14DRAFT_361618 [Mycena pura]|uniref:Alpha-type protein kinase domain-containing protein n=1 Tax=Mycena pura TaxID=153505 RepID=A0AAD6VKM5_9AGAR|nr:hypothetical protein GGX14DRAFT_361618 [Mycena pura]
MEILQEANVIYWASSILMFTYSFVDHVLELDGETGSPPPIPRLCFVDTGVALVHDQATGNTTPSNSTSPRCVYLLEELIDVSDKEADFVKYIHNGDALPLLEPADPLYYNAEFLCFAQHVQYFKSGGLVFISDLQGSADLLTDPQIMTSPTISRGKNMFGEGNVPKAFEAFPDQHQCNHYCTWFKLPPLKVAA